MYIWLFNSRVKFHAQIYIYALLKYQQKSQRELLVFVHPVFLAKSYGDDDNGVWDAEG